MAYLSLACVQLRAEAGLADVGPAACLAGRLALLPGLFGAPAQVRSSLLQLPCIPPAARSPSQPSAEVLARRQAH